jgi:hypothetical protein
MTIPRRAGPFSTAMSRIPPIPIFIFKCAEDFAIAW